MFSGKARGWASLGQVLPLGWTRDDYNRIVKSWVDEHQRPNTATENRPSCSRRSGATGSRRLSSYCSSRLVGPRDLPATLELPPRSQKQGNAVIY
jgi:hypothetical protein